MSFGWDAAYPMVDPTAAYISNTAPWPGLDKKFINPRNDTQTRASLMHMCSPIMDSTTVGQAPKATAPLLWIPLWMGVCGLRGS